MSMPDDSDRAASAGDLIPRPDPTRLTTEQLHRELDAAMAEVRRQIEDGRALLAVRIDNEVRRNDERHETLVEGVDHRFAGLHADIGEAVRHLRELHETRFTGIAMQFTERDTRTDQAAKAGKEALEAALLSAKELVAQQNEANRAAAAKTEQSFTKQIDAQAARIDELKERIDRGEGGQTGAAGQRNETRLNIGVLISVGLLLISLLTFVVLYVVKR